MIYLPAMLPCSCHPASTRAGAASTSVAMMPISHAQFRRPAGPCKNENGRESCAERRLVHWQRLQTLALVSTSSLADRLSGTPPWPWQGTAPSERGRGAGEDPSSALCHLNPARGNDMSPGCGPRGVLPLLSCACIPEPDAWKPQAQLIKVGGSPQHSS